MSDLYKQLVDALYAVPPPERKRHHWVMNREWYDAVAKLAGYPEERQIEKTMFGLPFRIHEDGGFPHLVPGYAGTRADADTLERAADILLALSRKPSSIILGGICRFLRDQAAKIRAQG